MIELATDDLRVEIVPEAGGRLASLRHHGRELLVGRRPDPMTWGAFPMVPWAGRVRHGRFVFGGRSYTLPCNLGAHAIHGVGFDRPWDVVDPHTLALVFDERWPFGGHALERFVLTPDALTLTMEVHADRASMPAQAGWHPWFVRPVTLELAAGAMYERDEEGVPTGERVVPSSGPWDDCFTDLAGPPVLRWPDGSSLTLHADVDHVVVYDEQDDALCVEPQSGPPDAFNLAPVVVEPGAPLVVTTRWRFTPPVAGRP